MLEAEGDIAIEGIKASLKVALHCSVILASELDESWEYLQVQSRVDDVIGIADEAAVKLLELHQYDAVDVKVTRLYLALGAHHLDELKVP
jgi:hypothetical protein